MFDRPTKQKSLDGLKDWIRMFVRVPFEGVPEKTREEILDEAERETAADLFHDGSWYIDYVRIRIRARRVG